MTDWPSDVLVDPELVLPPSGQFRFALTVAYVCDLPDPVAAAEHVVARLQGQVPCPGVHELLDDPEWCVRACPSCGAAL